MRAVGVGNVWVPAEADGTMWIHFGPHDAARFVSAASVLGGEVPPERLERKLVLVGVTAFGVGDQHVTPLGERLPGIEVHAQMLENIFDGRVLVRPRWAEWAEAGALLAAGGLVVLLTPAVGMLRAALLAGSASAPGSWRRGSSRTGSSRTCSTASRRRSGWGWSTPPRSAARWRRPIVSAGRSASGSRRSARPPRGSRASSRRPAASSSVSCPDRRARSRARAASALRP